MKRKLSLFAIGKLWYAYLMKPFDRKNALIKQIETTHGEEIEELLRRLFVDEHKTQKQIAEELSVSYLTVIRWLKRAGVRHRHINLGD